MAWARDFFGEEGARNTAGTARHLEAARLNVRFHGVAPELLHEHGRLQSHMLRTPAIRPPHTRHTPIWPRVDARVALRHLAKQRRLLVVVVNDRRLAACIHLLLLPFVERCLRLCSPTSRGSTIESQSTSSRHCQESSQSMRGRDSPSAICTAQC